MKKRSTLPSFAPSGRLRRWLHSHRPLAWVDSLMADYTQWSPDPPVIERLIR